MEFDNYEEGYELSEENYRKAVEAAKQEILKGYTVERDSIYLVQKLNFVQDIGKEARARGVAVADALCAAKGIIQALRLYYNNNSPCEEQISICNARVHKVGTAKSTSKDSNAYNNNNGEYDSIICAREGESNSTIEKFSSSNNNTYNHLITATTEPSVCNKYIELCFMELLVKVYTHLYLHTPVPTLAQWRRTLKQVLCCSDKDKDKGNTNATLSEAWLAMLSQKMSESSSGVMKQLLTSHLGVFNNISFSAVNNNRENLNETSNDCMQCVVDVNSIATKSDAENSNSELHHVTNNENNEDEEDVDEDYDDNGEEVEQYFKYFLQGCVLLARRRLKGSSKGNNTRTKSTISDERNSLIDVPMRNDMITAIQRYLLSVDIDW